LPTAPCPISGGLFRIPLTLGVISVLALLLVQGEKGRAKPPKPEDVAGIIGFLLRVHDGACPGLTFDPVAMSRMIDPRGMTLDFDESYAEVGSRIAGEGLPAYCDLVRTFFGRNPGETPGLVVR
jgi:hypothetical protein